MTPGAANLFYTGVVGRVRHSRVGSIPAATILLSRGFESGSEHFEKRFKNSWRNDTLTLPATRCMMPNIVAKKIFKSAHHARRRIKNQFLMIEFEPREF